MGNLDTWTPGQVIGFFFSMGMSGSEGGCPWRMNSWNTMMSDYVMIWWAIAWQYVTWQVAFFGTVRVRVICVILFDSNRLKSTGPFQRISMNNEAPLASVLCESRFRSCFSCENIFDNQYSKWMLFQNLCFHMKIFSVISVFQICIVDFDTKEVWQEKVGNESLGFLFSKLL